MLITLYILILLLNLPFAAKSKKNTFVLLITLIFMAVMMGGNTYTTDYPGYEMHYNMRTHPASIEVGYKLAAIAFRNIGLSYQQFLFIYELVGILIGFAALRRITNNYHYALLLYLLTAVFMDVNEVRQFTAYMLVALALTYLADRKRMIFELIMILACMFHISAIPFTLLPVFIWIMNSKRQWMRLYVVSILGLCLVIFTNGNRIPGLYELMKLFLDESKLAYFRTRTRLGFLLFFFGYFGIVLVTYMSCQEIRRTQSLKMKTNAYGNIIFAMVMYVSFALPFTIINSEFLRYFRFCIFPIIILMAAIMEKKNILCIRHDVIFIRYDLATFILLATYSIAFQHYRIVGEVFNNNLIN